MNPRAAALSIIFQRKFVRLGALVIVLLGLMVAVAALLTTGSKTSIAGGLIFALLPLAGYWAIKRPLFFPFTLFVIMVPFDNILKISQLGTLTKLLAILSGLLMVFWLLRNRRFELPPKALYAWLALVVWMGFTAFWAIQPSTVSDYLVTFAELFLLYFAAALMPATPDDLKAITVTTILGGAVAAAYGLYLYYQGGQNVFHERLIITGTSSVIDPNHFSAALILPLALGTIAALRTRLSVGKITLIVIDCIMIAGIYISGSRGGLVGVFVVLLYLLIASRYKTQIVLLMGLLFGTSLIAASSIWSRFAIAVSSGGAGRTSIWKVGLAAFKHHWLAGAGAGNFPAAYNQSFISTFERFNEGWGRVAHNLIISTAVELGVIGLLIMLLAWYSQVQMLNEIRRGHQLYDLRLAVQAATMGMFASAMFLDVMIAKYTWLLFIVAVLLRSAAKGNTPPVHYADRVRRGVVADLRPQPVLSVLSR